MNVQRPAALAMIVCVAGGMISTSLVGQEPAIASAPKNPSLWNELGAILQLEKNWPEAARGYAAAESGARLFADTQARGVNRFLTRALRGQGYVLIETGELRKAEKRKRR